MNAIIIDNCVQLSVSDLIRMSKSVNNIKISISDSYSFQIEIYCKLQTENGSKYLSFYKPEGYDRYLNTFKLDFKSSNLGIGSIPYVVCNVTGKRCSKLILYAGKVVTRHALTSYLYDCQTWSKAYRKLAQTYGKLFFLDFLYEQIQRPYFKKSYRHKETRRYQNIIEKIKTIEKDVEDFFPPSA